MEEPHAAVKKWRPVSSECTQGARNSPSPMSQEPESRHERATQLKQMVVLETMRRSSNDQVALVNSSFPTPSSSWRERVATWLYNVVDYLDVPRDVVFIAMNILDRYVCSGKEVCTSDRKQYELASITSMFLAIRLTGSNDLSVPSLLELSSTDLQVKDVLSMAARMLETLSWEHRILTPSAFVKSMLGIFQSFLSKETMFALYELASYLAEISVCDEFFVTIPPSEIALAAVAVAINDHHDFSLHQKTSSYFVQRVLQETGMSVDAVSVKRTYNRLRCIYQQSDDYSPADSLHVIVDDEEIHEAFPSSQENGWSIDLFVHDNSCFDLRPVCLQTVNAPK